MMLVMNAMGYDAMVVGNHEFNFGLGNLQKARESARFPWLSANTLSSGALPPFAPYLVKTVAGVKVAVIGVTTARRAAVGEAGADRRPDVPADRGRCEARARGAGAGEAGRGDRGGARRARPRPEARAAARPGESPLENRVLEIAEQYPQLAVIVYGHTHQREEGKRVGNVLLVQPRNGAAEVARIDITLARDAGGSFKVASAVSRLLPVTPETKPDAKVLEIARPYHEAAERYLEQPVARAAVELSGARGRFEDSAIVDAIQEVQMHYAQADVSFSALFRPQARVPRGPVTVRDLAGLYVYDNELYAVEGNGRMVKEALENAARFFRSCPDPSCATGPLLDRSIAGYNFDMAQGVGYEIDLTQPVGSRIRNLRYHGEPLRDEQPLRIAINNYRAAGSSGYTMFRGAKVVWRSGRDIRELMVEYFTEHKSAAREARRQLAPRPAARRRDPGAGGSQPALIGGARPAIRGIFWRGHAEPPPPAGVLDGGPRGRCDAGQRETARLAAHRQRPVA